MSNSTKELATLTSKQRKVLQAVETYIKSKGLPPTVREIGEMVGEKTPGSVQGILNRLEQKGVIKRTVGMARSIQLVTDDSQYLTPIYVPEIKKVSTRNVKELLNIYNIKIFHPVSPELIEKDKKYFILACPDISLTKASIKYEDFLIINIDYDELKDGDIVLILYDNHAMLRYYYPGKQKDTVILKADSDLLNKEVFNNDEVKIIGKLVGRIVKH